MKSIEVLEEVCKGFANERRISILMLLSRYFDLDVEYISEKLNISYPSTAAHLQKLYDANLVSKEDDGYYVLHRLTPRGRQVVNFLCRIR